MQLNTKLKKEKININHVLISNKPISDFYIAHQSIEGTGNLGSSSIRKPIDKNPSKKISMNSVSLEDFLKSKEIDTESQLALWIDVEGSGFEVLESINRKSKQISLLHIESELKQRWTGQKLKKDVIELCIKYELKFSCHSFHDSQQDLIFISKEIYHKHKFRIKLVILFTKLFGPSSSRILQVLQ